MAEIYTYETNPLGKEAVGTILRKMSIPAVIANLISSLYNVVDQIFIGNKIGYLGNAATNIAYPLTTICLAIGLMMGLGSAAGFNLALGRKRPDIARQFAGSDLSGLILFGLICCILVEIFLTPLMLLFGATENFLDYACDYSRIIAIGLPLQMIAFGFSPLVRGDGAPMYSMISISAGAVVNIILDYVLMYPLDMGIQGAAIATVIGEAVTAIMLVVYVRRFKSVQFELSDFIPRIKPIVRGCQLGFLAFVFQASTLLVMIIVNRLFRKYGDLTIYGSDVCIAVIGILMKIISLNLAIHIGMNQGGQPIVSFNYGAKKYRRVRDTIKLQIIVVTITSTFFFLMIQLFPRQLFTIFGSGDETYFACAEMMARRYAALLFLSGYLMAASTFFTAIGKPFKGSLLALIRQVFTLIPLTLILGNLFGVNGVTIASPVSEAISCVLTTVFFYTEMKSMPKENMDEESLRAAEAESA